MKKKQMNCICQFECKKIIKVMKLTIFFFLIGLLTVSAESYSQQAKLNLNMRDAQIIDVLNAIERQSEFYFFFKNDEINEAEKINAQFHEASIDNILIQVLKNTDLKYKIVDTVYCDRT